MVQEENCRSWSEKFLWLLKFIVCMHVLLSVPMCGYVHVASTGQPQMSFFGGHPPCFWEDLLTGLQLVKWDRLAGQRDPETCLSLPCHLWKCKYVLPYPALFESRFWGSNSGLHTCKVSAWPTEPSSQLYCSKHCLFLAGKPCLPSFQSPDLTKSMLNCPPPTCLVPKGQVSCRKICIIFSTCHYEHSTPKPGLTRLN